MKLLGGQDKDAACYNMHDAAKPNNNLIVVALMWAAAPAVEGVRGGHAHVRHTSGQFGRTQWFKVYNTRPHKDGMGGPHAVLGVGVGVGRDEIRAAFRKKALECHPDVGGDAGRFRAVRDAYESLVKSPETEEEEAERLYHEMKRATEWAGSSSGTAGFGNVEFVKHGKSVKVVGRMKAGEFSYDGRITAYNDVSSPPWGEHKTVLSGDSVQIEGNVINGAVIRGRDVFVVDVVGLRRVVGDAVRAGVFHDRSLGTRIEATGNVVARNCHGPAYIRGRTVDVGDLRDGSVVEAGRAVIRGTTVTHDVTVKVSESLAFATSHMLGLSDDCTVSWDGGSVKLGRLKTFAVGRLSGMDGVPGTLVGGGFEITRTMLERAARRGWNPFARG